MRVWIDQDLCTGDGLCTDHCPDMFTMLEDGISYVHGPGAAPQSGGLCGAVDVAPRCESAVIAAALDCPGECIFIEPGDDEAGNEPDDIIDAEVVVDPSGELR